MLGIAVQGKPMAAQARMQLRNFRLDRFLFMLQGGQSTFNEIQLRVDAVETVAQIGGPTLRGSAFRSCPGASKEICAVTTRFVRRWVGTSDLTAKAHLTSIRDALCPSRSIDGLAINHRLV